MLTDLYCFRCENLLWQAFYTTTFLSQTYFNVNFPMKKIATGLRAVRIRNRKLFSFDWLTEKFETLHQKNDLVLFFLGHKELFIFICYRRFKVLLFLLSVDKIKLANDVDYP